MTLPTQPKQTKPVECPGCHELIGHTDESGALYTCDGNVITHLQMLHRCGKTFYWNAIMEKWDRSMEKREKATFSD